MMQSSDWQPELFQEFQQTTQRPPWWARYWRVPHRMLILRVAHEDVILAGVGALMVVVLGFCLGVERGKRLVVAPAGQMAVPALSLAPGAVPAAAPAVAAPLMRPTVMPTAPGRVVAPPLAPAAQGRYVVQVASFTDQPSATAAQARLAPRGFRTTVATKGKYCVLYAEGFATYADATEAVNRLRGTYRDCFVRKLLTDRRG